ncbi:hypothetical protein [Actinacidiphila reveromycinica]|uniref:hypothetical protein n=1 Tax=Actinacidiphila reveromycinica TaxID=659352 RepID=UPI001923C6DC|nr:hypothetical protein [Streptomyces sp. SN-593]
MSAPATVPTGQVVRATREEDGAQVAITYLAPALVGNAPFRAALRAEAERLRTVVSPHVVAFHAYVEDGPHAALVRDPVEGVILAALLDGEGATSPEAALTVLKGSLLGLSAAHEAGIAGGAACAPANLLVTPEGVPALIDLGSTSGTVEAVAADPGDTGPERVHATTGTPSDAHPYVAADLLAAAAACRACLTAASPLPPAGDPEAAEATEDAEAADTAQDTRAAGDNGAPTPGKGAQDTDAQDAATTAPAAAAPADAAAPAAPADASDGSDGSDGIPDPVRPLLAAGLAADPSQRPHSAGDFAVALEAVAVAAYGEAWEERGRTELAARVAAMAPAGAEGAEGTGGAEGTAPAPAAVPVRVPLPAPAPAAPTAPQRSGAAAAFGAGAGAGGGVGGGEEDPRADGRRRRRKALLIAAAAVVVAGALTAGIVAAGGKHDTAAAADPSPTASAVSTATTPTAGSASPPAEATSPPASATTPPPSTTSAPSDPTGAPTTATSAPAATPATTAIHRAAPPSPSPSQRSPHVTSVTVTGARCSDDGHTASATIRVRYDGSAGTLRATWWRSATAGPQGAVDLVSPQTVQFPTGSTSFTYSGKVSDVAEDRSRPYVGITVATSPEAASGNNSFAIVCR